MAGKKYVTSACLNCRRRKVKCDGKQTCANCLMSKLTCAYDSQDDLRRVSAKKVIAELRARVAELEDMTKKDKTERDGTSRSDLRRLLQMYDSRASGSEGEPSQNMTEGLGASSSAAAGELSGQIESTSAADAASSTASIPGLKHAAPPNMSRPIASGASTDQITHELPSAYNLRQPAFVSNVPEMGHSDQDYLLSPALGAYGTTAQSRTFQYDVSWPIEDTQGQQQQQFQRQQPEEDDAIAADDDDDDEVTKLLATRMGSLRIAEDGQLRYYGPTSNLHVQSNGCHSLSQSTIRQVATEGSGVLHRLGIGQEVPLELENHLARLYFAWEDPAIHVADEESFFEEKQRHRSSLRATPYYSETLNNAICAIGATMAVGEILNLPEPAHEFFSSRAKALLDIEMDSPTVATVQALVIMSATEAAFTRDARGWLYSGMAARLSAELGLHLDVTQHISTGMFSEEEVKTRRTTFWGVYIHENMWSLYTGRPWGLDLRHITVPRPSPQLDGSGGKTWKPYPNIASPYQLITRERKIPFPIESCTDATITLCELMRSINTTLYSGQVMEKDVLKAFLVKTRRMLYNWLDTLPACLKIDLQHPDATYSPAVLQLHMQFYGTVISLYRPYLSSNLNTVIESQGSTYQAGSITSRNVTTECIEVGRQVAELLRCYKKQHTLKRVNVMLVHIVFSACLILTYDVTRGQTTQESRISLQELQFCCHSLGEIGQSFGNARRALEVITLVKSEWEKLVAARRSPNANLKRSSMSISASSQCEYSPSKRPQHMSTMERGSLDTNRPRPPPSFGAFQTICDGYLGHQQDMNFNVSDMAEKPSDGPFFGGDCGLGEPMPSMVWLEGLSTEVLPSQGRIGLDGNDDGI